MALFPLRIPCIVLLSFLALPLQFAHAQGTVPTFQHAAGQGSYTLAGGDPAKGGATTIPTVLVPIMLSFDAKKTAGKPFVMDAGPDVARVLRSPIYSKFAFPSGGTTQYADAMLRTTFPKAEGWHTLLGKPEVKLVKIAIPVGYGYILTSKKTGASFAVVDVEFLQKELFQQLPKQPASWSSPSRTTPPTTPMATPPSAAPGERTASIPPPETPSSSARTSMTHPPWSKTPTCSRSPSSSRSIVNDPLHDPLVHGRNVKVPGNTFPGWLRPASMRPGDQGGCGGTGVASTYFLLEPTNTNPKNNIPASKPFVAKLDADTWHLQNVALLPWYTGASEGLGSTYSFPDAQALPEPAKPCPARGGRGGGASAPPKPTVAAVPLSGSPNGHQLIGYWAGYGGPGSTIPLREVSPQWDVIIVAFATPDRNAPEGTMQFHTPAGLDTEQFKADIA